MLLAFCSCSETEAEKQVEAVQEGPVDTIRTTGISKVNGAYVIDTVAILNNENLDTLLTVVEQAELATYDNVKDIPPFIRAFLDSLTGGGFSIVNYGEEWQETDVIEEGLAERELVYLGKNRDAVLLAYHTGGFGKSEHILIFRHEGSEITDFWAGNILKTLKTKEEIVEYLKENKNKEWRVNTNRLYL